MKKSSKNYPENTSKRLLTALQFGTSKKMSMLSKKDNYAKIKFFLLFEVAHDKRDQRKDSSQLFHFYNSYYD